MLSEKLKLVLNNELKELGNKGILKGKEMAVTAIKPAKGKRGPRYLVQGFEEDEFLRMNSNSYLGLSENKDVKEAEEKGAVNYGTGPGAVRFISGTYKVHLDLENKLAAFHNREACMIFSSAYATVIGLLPPLVDEETVILTDDLNHNSIINAIRLSRPRAKDIFAHKDMTDLERAIKKHLGKCRRLIIITDGIFSMRGDYAPLDAIAGLKEKYTGQVEEGIIVIVDDSHGVGAFGKTGRGTEEYTNAKDIDILISTLGKSLGVNGGYLVSGKTIIDYLRETAPFYIYSNPITPPEACAAIKALEILDSDTGLKLLEKLRALTNQFERGLLKLGLEILESEHPIVPLMVRDSGKTSRLIRHLIDHRILATGLNYPVVPRGDEEIRFQVSAAHTEYDIKYVLDTLAKL